MDGERDVEVDVGAGNGDDGVLSADLKVVVTVNADVDDQV